MVLYQKKELPGIYRWIQYIYETQIWWRKPALKVKYKLWNNRRDAQCCLKGNCCGTDLPGYWFVGNGELEKNIRMSNAQSPASFGTLYEGERLTSTVRTIGLFFQICPANQFHYHPAFTKPPCALFILTKQKQNWAFWICSEQKHQHIVTSVIQTWCFEQAL
jgi:hypothetical protein